MSWQFVPLKMKCGLLDRVFHTIATKSTKRATWQKNALYVGIKQTYCKQKVSEIAFLYIYVYAAGCMAICKNI